MFNLLIASSVIDFQGLYWADLTFQIFKGYEEILEDLIRGRIQNLWEGLSPINFHTHCALLWLVVTAINIPSLIYWVNSFR